MNDIRQLVIEALSIRGYIPIFDLDLKLEKDKDISMFYEGNIKIEDNVIKFLLDFSNLSLLDFPNVYFLEETVSFLKNKYIHIQEPIPHLRKEKCLYKDSCLYSICYQLHNSNIIPRDNIFLILDIIEKHLYDFLNKIIHKDLFLNEYVVDFGGSVLSLINLNDKFECWFMSKCKGEWCFFEFDYKSYRLNLNLKIKREVFEVHHSSIPNFLSLIKEDKISIKDFQDFVKKWNVLSYQKFMSFLKTPSASKEFVFIWKGMTLAGYFKWERNTDKSLNSSRNKHLRDENVYFVNTQILDFKKNVLRNLPDKSSQGLLQKKVLLVGLGAIGGYMAEALVKLGAGIESDFVLVDKDILEADNVGRHLLGFQFCGNFKSLALISYLQSNSFFQLSKIKPEIKDISLFNNSFFENENFDLIIDATGSIEVQEYLNEMIQSLSKEKRPILQHLWVFGNGECVQALWVDPKIQTARGGCISCLGSSSKGLHQELLPVQNLLPEQRTGVCSAFTPYAVSGGMMAASLGINMILEWLQTGKVVNNYQTRYSSIDIKDKIQDITLTRHKECRFCGEIKQ